MISWYHHKIYRVWKEEREIKREKLKTRAVLPRKRKRKETFKGRFPLGWQRGYLGGRIWVCVRVSEHRRSRTHTHTIRRAECMTENFFFKTGWKIRGKFFNAVGEKEFLVKSGKFVLHTDIHTHNSHSLHILWLTYYI